MVAEIYQARFDSAREAMKRERWTTSVKLFPQSHASTYAVSADVGGRRFGKRAFVVWAKKS